MSNESTKNEKEKYEWLEECWVDLQPLPVDGWILDIGGGGEGIIGELMGSQVVAIDSLAEELEEAAPGPLKIIMDAGDLQFLDDTFSAATAFFCFMYIRQDAELRKILSEVHRVLQPGGQLWVWDVLLPSGENKSKDIFVVPLKVQFPNGKIIDTGYGQLWPETARDQQYYEQIAVQSGFVVESITIRDALIEMRLKKPEI